MNLGCLASTALDIYGWVILSAILLSWFQVPTDHPIGAVKRGVAAVTEPVLAPIRRVIPAVRLGNAALDLSPLILLIAVRILAGLIPC